MLACLPPVVRGHRQLSWKSDEEAAEFSRQLNSQHHLLLE